jgi:hypothetical protein
VLYARGAAPAAPAAVLESLRRASLLAAPERLWVVGGPAAELASSILEPPAHVLVTAARGALPMLPALLELGRLSAGDALCVLAPDDLQVADEDGLRLSVAVARDQAVARPRSSLVIGLAEGPAGAGGSWIVPAAGGDRSSRPLEALFGSVIAPRSRPETVVLRNSGFVIGRLSSILALYKDFLPGAFLALVQAWLAGQVEQTLASLPEASLDRDLLPRALRRLRVVMPAVAEP